MHFDVKSLIYSRKIIPFCCLLLFLAGCGGGGGSDTVAYYGGGGGNGGDGNGGYDVRVPDLSPVHEDTSDDNEPYGEYRLVITGVEHSPNLFGVGYGLLGNAGIKIDGYDPVNVYVSGGSGHALTEGYYSYSEGTLTFILDDVAECGDNVGDDYRTFNNIMIDNARYSIAGRIYQYEDYYIDYSEFDVSSIKYGIRVSSDVSKSVQGDGLVDDIGDTLGSRSDAVLYYSIDGEQYTANGSLQMYESDPRLSRYCGRLGYLVYFETKNTNSPRITVHGISLGGKLYDNSFILQYAGGDPVLCPNLNGGTYTGINTKDIEWYDFY